MRRGTSTAERSYPASEVRGIGQECQAATAQERPRGATLRPRSGGATERSYPGSEVRGGDERSYPAFKVSGGGQKELPHTHKPEARGGSQEQLPHVQGALAAQAQ